MTEKKIVVCDGDKEYVTAFVSYLVEHIPHVTIHSFTSEEMFLNCEETYQVGILSREFLEVLEFSGKDLLEEKFYLCDERMEDEYKHLPMVYKYQSMEIVEEMLKRLLQKETGDWWGEEDSKTKVVGIYSPISHELSMPFGLALCQVFREQGKVLFLDIEEISIMGVMMGQQCKKSLMDFLYLVIQQEKINMGEFVRSFMGIDYLCPFAGPEELNDIKEEDWTQLMRCVCSLGYDTVVVLFGRTLPGFRHILSLCHEFILLGKPGDYYQKSQKNFIEYLQRTGEDINLRQVFLPMSAGNLVDGTYIMEELIQGNLGLFVKKVVQEGYCGSMG